MLPRFALSLLLADTLAFVATFAVVPFFTRAHLLLFVLMVVVFARAGLYHPRLTLSVLDDLPWLVGGLGLATSVSVTVAFAKSEGSAELHVLPRAVLLIALVVAIRVVAYIGMRWLRRTGVTARRAVIVGADAVGRTLARHLQEHPEHGLRVVGFVDAAPPVTGSPLTAPLLGGEDYLATLLHRHRAHVAVAAFVSGRDTNLIRQLRLCSDREIFVVPRMLHIHGRSQYVDMVHGIPLIRIHHGAFRSLTWPLKRVLDVVISSMALVLAAPVMALVAVAVRWEMGPGVLFRQVRLGMDGRPFVVVKFRSLRATDGDETDQRWSVAGDGRIGPVGRLIRATSLDELPQLFTILRGDMSLVGPRPERPYFVEQFAEQFPQYQDRHRVPAGLTGYAAVHGLRGDTSIEERADFDNLYIDSWSLWLDVKIFLRTFGSVVNRTGS